MGRRPWWYDAIQASKYVPGVAPWEWLKSPDRVAWMHRALDAAAAEQMAQVNRG